AEGQRGVRGQHGRRAGRVRPPARPGTAGGNHRRGRQATDRGRAAAAADPAGEAEAGGLRVRPGRYGEPVPGVRAAGRRAAGRGVGVRDGKTSQAFARFARRVLDEWYPAADRVVFVLDNLSTHAPAAFYEAFPPAEARRLCERVEWHYTPKHGSWLNVAELELSVLARQWLDRRIPDIAALRRGGAGVGARR